MAVAGLAAAGDRTQEPLMIRPLHLFLALVLAAPSLAGEVTLPRTSTHTLTSEANGVEYELRVSLPRGYEESSGSRYPVIYLLDADYSFAIAHNVVEHLADRDHLRWAIVVGIAYAGPNRYRLNRTRDYTPTRSMEGGYGPEYQKHSGEASSFRTFIREELIPWVSRSWRTTDERVLVGHSYGGLFAAWTLLTDPSLFSHYVIVSPSLWYDDRMIFELDAVKAASSRRVYLAVGSREGGSGREMVGDLVRFGRELEKRGDIVVRREVLEDETHNSVFPSALSRGIRFVMKGR